MIKFKSSPLKVKGAGTSILYLPPTGFLQFLAAMHVPPISRFVC